MARVSPLLFVPPVIFAVLAAVFFFGMQREDPEALPSARAGGPAPELTVTPLPPFGGFDADTLRQPGIKLVNFWASWCAPCRAEHPHLEELAAQGLTIYGINYKDDPAKAKGFLDELGNPFAGIVADGSGRTGIDWGIYGVPETFLIDGDGKVLLRFAGPLTERSIDSTLRPALEKAGVTLPGS